jgi:hypothetical protein
MYGKSWLISLLAAALALVIATTSSSRASTPCERQQLWEKDFAYIYTISLTCRIVITTAEVGAAAYFPYPSIAQALGGGLAGQVLNYAAAFGVNLRVVPFDEHHICRLVRAGTALSHQQSPGVRRQLLHYGLCPSTDDACKSRFKTEIFEHYRLTDACAQT